MPRQKEAVEYSQGNLSDPIGDASSLEIERQACFFKVQKSCQTWASELVRDGCRNQGCQSCFTAWKAKGGFSVCQKLRRFADQECADDRILVRKVLVESANADASAARHRIG